MANVRFGPQADAAQLGGPTNKLCFVVSGTGRNARRIRIGAAFRHRESNGVNLVREAILTGDRRVVMLEFNARTKAQSDNAPAGRYTTVRWHLAP